MSRTHTLLTVFVALLMVTAGGCMGWGTDGPDEQNEATNTTDQEVTNNTSTDESQQEDADEQPASNEGQDTQSEEGPPDDQEDQQNEQNQQNTQTEQDQEQENQTEQDTTEEEYQTLTVETYDYANEQLVTADVTVEHQSSGESQSRTTEDGPVEFEVVPGTYTVTADFGNEEQTQTVEITDSDEKLLFSEAPPDEDDTGNESPPDENNTNETVPTTITVVDETDYPIEGATVAIGNQGVKQTAENGQVTFYLPPDETYTVDVGDHNHVSSSATINSGENKDMMMYSIYDDGPVENTSGNNTTTAV